jgi:gas vesicle protein
MEKENNLLEALLLGGLIGMALGVLFAPSAGEKTREMLKDKIKELDFGDIFDRFSEAYEEGRVEMEKAMKEVQM